MCVLRIFVASHNLLFLRQISIIIDQRIRAPLKWPVFLPKSSFNDTRVTDDIITRDKTEYSSHALAEVMNGKQI